jgi:hypothetical protein
MMTGKTGYQRSGGTAIKARGVESGTIYTEGTIMSWVKGVIRSQYVGLVRTGVRMNVGERADLRVRWARMEAQRFVVGQTVVATIPAEAVRLEHGMFRRSKQRWNRWFGRIVLVQQVEAGTVYTVKVHGEVWTLKSFGPVLGAQRPSKPWDDVNILIDPQAVELSIEAPCRIVHT